MTTGTSSSDLQDLQANLLADGRAVLATQPFSVLMGVQLDSLMPGGTVQLHLPLTEKLHQQNGFAHGGVVSYMADNALSFAGGFALQAPIVTSEFKINYLRPVVGQRLIARGHAIHTGRAQAVCGCELFAVMDGVEKLCAVAQGTVTLLKPPK